MINKITFTGRETMLTKGIEKGVEKGTASIHEYLGAGKIFENIQPKKDIKPQQYTSPFNPTGLVEEEIPTLKIVEKLDNIATENLGKSYALAHGTPENAIQELNILA